MRVLLPATSHLVASPSASWVLRVDPENAADIAQAILRDHGITEATVHSSGVSDRATARWNIVDLAAGRQARRSSYQNAPGGSTRVDVRLLAALRSMGGRMSLSVSEISGGSHAPHSAHYDGEALDINVINGRHVGGGASYSAVVSTCRAFGATAVYSPSYDPYGGHNNHVHCEWS
jgi:(2Fe-2S) ferredoxin